MDIGLWIDELRPFPEVIATVEKAAAAGVARVWIGDRAGWDALTLFAAVGDRAPGIGFGTAVTTTMPRHPLALAAQALTTQAATGGRLTLGIGPSHAPLVRGRYGLPFDRPGTHTEEYLRILGPALRGADADLDGQVLSGHGGVAAPGTTAPPVLLSAHGPRLMRLAGELADGVLSTWTSPRGAADVVAAVGAASSGSPQVVVTAIMALTDEPDTLRAEVGAAFDLANRLPTYRRWLDHQGLDRAVDTVIAGDERTIAAAVRAYADAGVTELQVAPAGSPQVQDRTVAYVVTL